jgi:hypothetical protein
VWAAVVRVGRLIDLDTELRVDEDGAISREVVHDNAFVIIPRVTPAEAVRSNSQDAQAPRKKAVCAALARML